MLAIIVSERRVHLGNGIFIGAGMIMIILGFSGWFVASFLFWCIESYISRVRD
jgi:hypothetical protein